MGIELPVLTRREREKSSMQASPSSIEWSTCHGVNLTSTALDKMPSLLARALTHKLIAVGSRALSQLTKSDMVHLGP